MNTHQNQYICNYNSLIKSYTFVCYYFYGLLVAAHAPLIPTSPPRCTFKFYSKQKFFIYNNFAIKSLKYDQIM